MIQLALNVGKETNFDGSGTQTVTLNDATERVTYTGQDELSWVIDHNVGLVNAAIVYKDNTLVLAFALKPNIMVNDDNTHTLTTTFLERHHQTLGALNA